MKYIAILTILTSCTPEYSPGDCVLRHYRHGGSGYFKILKVLPQGYVVQTYFYANNEYYISKKEFNKFGSDLADKEGCE